MSFAHLLDILVLPCQTVLVKEAKGRTLIDVVPEKTEKNVKRVS